MPQDWESKLFHNSWAQKLGSELKTEIAENVILQNVASERDVIRQGDEFSGLICVIEGKMKVVGTARRGDELLIGLLRPGDWTGFLSALDRRSYAFSVRAVGECLIAKLPAEATKRIFERDVERFKLLLIPELRVSRNTYKYLIELAYQPPTQRLAERMLGLGRWPYSVGHEQPAELESVSQSDLANATRLSRQTINNILQTMVTHKLVEVGYRTVRVLDADRMVLVANGELILE